MDSSRYKRRETQTRRQITNDFRGPIAVRSAHSRDPFVARPLAPIIPVTVPQPIELARAPQPLAPAPAAPAPIAPAAATISSNRRQPISMAIPGAPSPEKVAGVKVLKSRWRAARKWVLRSTAIGLVLVIAGSGLVVSQGWLKAKKVFHGGTTSAAALQTNVNPQLLKGEGDGRINVLLLGRGGGTHDAPDLTDTMMVASIDPVNHTSTLLSLPRDMWVKVPGAGSMKINAAWETGKYKYLGKVSPNNPDAQGTLAGFATVDQAVEGVLGVPIHYNVLVDFDAFKQAVDTVGGISVTVPEDLVDPTIAWENGNNSVIAKAGSQTFTGAHALLYTRSRETSSDFARGQRQRTVLLALKEKIGTIGTLTSPTKLASLANAFGSNVQTDLSLTDAARFADIVKNVDNTNVNSIGLADAPNSFVTTAAVNGQSVVQPKAGDEIFLDDDEPAPEFSTEKAEQFLKSVGATETRKVYQEGWF